MASPKKLIEKCLDKMTSVWMWIQLAVAGVVVVAILLALFLNIIGA